MSFYGKNRIPIPATKSYVALTVGLSLVITILFSPWRWSLPPFLLMVIAFWSVRNPHWMTMGSAMLLGILLDVVYNNTVGVSMLELLLVAYFMGRLRYRFEIYSFFQQSVIVFFIFFLSKAPSLLLIYLIQDIKFSWGFFLPSLLAGLCWFPLVMLMVFRLYRPVQDQLNTHTNL
jgi:rod shape-determining protein MreD